jgi:hypothetical protein
MIAGIESPIEKVLMTTFAQFLMTRRGRGLLLITACASAATLSNLVVPGATASTAPVATTVKSVVVSGLAAPPGAPNNPSAVIVASSSFSVAVTFSDADGKELPPSWTKDSTVTLTVEPPATGGEPPSPAGDAQFVGQKTIVGPAGAATATVSGFMLSPADNRVRIGAKITAGSKEAKAIAKGFSAQFDVVLSAVASDTNAQTFLSTSGDPTECVPTSTSPYCVDLHLPFGSETGSLLTVGKCDSFLGCSSTDQRVVQALMDLGPDYSAASPAFAVFKCDKTACPGNGVPSYHVLVNLAATGPLATAPACSAKGAVDPGPPGFCVDYRQSKRDNAGDLHLYLLLARDARMSCC